jgi:hypothetical protein
MRAGAVDSCVTSRSSNRIVAGIGGEGAGDLVDEGCLARAVGADDRVRFTGQDLELQRRQRRAMRRTIC